MIQYIRIGNIFFGNIHLLVKLQNNTNVFVRYLTFLTSLLLYVNVGQSSCSVNTKAAKAGKPQKNERGCKAILTQLL